MLKPKLNDLNQHLICQLCSGYMIDATTLTECLHSFCRSCILRYLPTSSRETDRGRCPVCESEIHLAQIDRHLRADYTLQDIIYKTVPGLYREELDRRREYYRSQCRKQCQLRGPFASPKNLASGSGVLRQRIFDRHLVELAAFICTPEELVSLCIQYLPPVYEAKLHEQTRENIRATRGDGDTAGSGSSSKRSKQQHTSTSQLSPASTSKESPSTTTTSRRSTASTTTTNSPQKKSSARLHEKQQQHKEIAVAELLDEKKLEKVAFKRYFRCAAAVCVVHLKKLLHTKLELPPNYHVELRYGEEVLEDMYSLMDIAYIYNWRRDTPMQLSFSIYQSTLDYDNEQMPTLEREELPVLDKMASLDSTKSEMSMETEEVDSVKGETDDAAPECTAPELSVQPSTDQPPPLAPVVAEVSAPSTCVSASSTPPSVASTTTTTTSTTKSRKLSLSTIESKSRRKSSTSSTSAGRKRPSKRPSPSSTTTTTKNEAQPTTTTASTDSTRSVDSDKKQTHSIQETVDQVVQSFTNSVTVTSEPVAVAAHEPESSRKLQQPAADLKPKSEPKSSVTNSIATSTTPPVMKKMRCAGTTVVPPTSSSSPTVPLLPPSKPSVTVTQQPITAAAAATPPKTTSMLADALIAHKASLAKQQHQQQQQQQQREPTAPKATTSVQQQPQQKHSKTPDSHPRHSKSPQKRHPAQTTSTSTTTCNNNNNNNNNNTNNNTNLLRSPPPMQRGAPPPWPASSVGTSSVFDTDALTPNASQMFPGAAAFNNFGPMMPPNMSPAELLKLNSIMQMLTMQQAHAFLMQHAQAAASMQQTPLQPHSATTPQAHPPPAPAHDRNRAVGAGAGIKHPNSSGASTYSGVRPPSLQPKPVLPPCTTTTNTHSGRVGPPPSLSQPWSLSASLSNQGQPTMPTLNRIQTGTQQPRSITTPTTAKYNR